MVHRTVSHNTDECFSKLLKPTPKAKEKEEREFNKPSSYYYLKEYSPTYKKLEILGKLHHQDVTFILDTGADSNYISEDALVQLKMTNTIQQNEKTVVLGDGTTIKSSAKIQAEFTICGIEKTSMKEEFFVLPKLTEPRIILGISFMKRQM